MLILLIIVTLFQRRYGFINEIKASGYYNWEAHALNTIGNHRKMNLKKKKDNPHCMVRAKFMTHESTQSRGKS
jgi:N12 class adenine-specific DNA methylase